MQINWTPNKKHRFVARAVTRRNPELHHLHWDTTFAPTTREPWNDYSGSKLTFNSSQLQSQNDFWTPLGHWELTADEVAPISPANAIEVLLDDEVVATLTAPGQQVIIQTPWDTGGNNPRMTARLTAAPLATAEVLLRWLAEYDLNGQHPEIKMLDDLLMVEYLDRWSTPVKGAMTFTPKIYDAGGLVDTGPTLTLAVSGDGGGGS